MRRGSIVLVVFVVGCSDGATNAITPPSPQKEAGADVLVEAEAGPWAPAPNDPDWVNVMTVGAVGDGKTDDTGAFRKAAATGKKVFVPKPPSAYVLSAFVALQNSIYGDGSMPEIRMTGADGDPDQGHTHNMVGTESAAAASGRIASTSRRARTSPWRIRSSRSRTAIACSSASTRRGRLRRRAGSSFATTC